MRAHVLFPYSGRPGRSAAARLSYLGMILIAGAAFLCGVPDLARAAGRHLSVSDSPGQGINVPARDGCSGGGQLFVSHDGSFESAYAWNGFTEPYIGAFGESYDLGPGRVRCGVFWLTCTDPVPPTPTEVYVWDRGVSDEPGTVLARVQGVQFQNVATWPEFGENVVPIDVQVSGDFTIGYWSGFRDLPVWYIGADLDGSGGYPWSYSICGDVPGWCPVDWWWGPTQALGIGVYFDAGGTPVETGTWGRIKSLY